MRILTLCHEYPPVGGGGATAAEILAEALVRRGHEVDVLTSGMRDLPAREIRAGVTIHRAASVRRHRHYSTTAELLTTLPTLAWSGMKLLRERRHDLIHCHFIVPGGIVAVPLAAHHGVPCVITAHGSDVPGYNPDRFQLVHTAIGPAWRRVTGGAAALTAPSRFLGNLVRARIDRPIELIANPFDPPPIDLGAGPRENRILAASRLVERKGIQFIIDAMARIGCDWELCVAGDGPLRPSLEARAAAAGVRARFLGMVPRSELGRLYRTSKLFAFPSLQENFPMVLLEAMAGGCAVLTSDAPGCKEVVGEAGLVSPAGDVTALAECLAKLTSDPDLVDGLGVAGMKRAAGFASSRIAAEFESLFLRCTMVGQALDAAAGDKTPARARPAPRSGSARS
jgi:glycosyltransferase involved in cell wall biosynthesis